MTRSGPQPTGVDLARPADGARALHSTEAQYRELIESVRDYAIFWLDPAGVVQSWNPGAERLKQYTAAEIIGQHFSRFYPAEDLAADKPARELVQAIEQGRFEDEGWRLRKDGSRFWANVVITPMHDADGGLTGFSKVTRDLSVRKLAEDAMRIANDELELRVHERTHQLQVTTDRLELALIAGKLGTWDWDLASNQLVWSSTLKRIFGYDSGDAVTSIDDFKARRHPDDDAWVQQRIEQSLATREVYDVEYRVVWPDGSVHWVAVQGRCILEAGKPVRMVGTAANIDDRKRDQAALEELVRTRTEALVRAQAALVDAAKMSALGEMAGGIAHEINTPLAAILLKAQQLERAAGGAQPIASDTLARTARGIADTSRRIGVIIRGLRSFARDGAADPFASVPAQQIVQSVLDLCQARFKSHGVELRVQAPEPALGVECRMVQIEQVLINLLNNAFDAVQDREVDKRIALEIADRGDRVEFVVSDTGPGIPCELRAQIMQPFFTTKPVGRGTGLGLSIARGIVDEHGGALELDVASEQTRFVVTLPKTHRRDSNV